MADLDKLFGPIPEIPKLTDKKDMKNYLLREIINVVSALIVSYLIAVFVFLEFNIFGWTELGRIIYLIFFVIIYKAKTNTMKLNK
jgi:hypothetical protein|tara:strand:+ start:6400 stop:6654 length:255 start_codon:yes stop_codon:yes gene_type:complete